MKNKIIIAILLVGILALVLNVVYYATSYQDAIDYIKVEGENQKKQKYSLITYPEDSFVYGFNNEKNIELEVEEISPIKHDMWDILWSEGDLYCEKSQIEIANEYYNSDANYDWYFILDTEDKEIEEKIVLDESEISYMEEIDDNNINSAIFFEEMEKFGSLMRVSKDKLVQGTVTLVKHEGNWYWKSDVIDEEKETDGEYATYVKPLPESINKKIKELEQKIENKK